MSVPIGKKNVETYEKSIDFFIGLWYDTLSRIVMKGQTKKWILMI